LLGNIEKSKYNRNTSVYHTAFFSHSKNDRGYIVTWMQDSRNCRK